jgi:hypothetical protein
MGANYYDPADTEKYRANTKASKPLGVMRTKLCASCKKLRSVTQYHKPESKICNHCKRRIR